MKKWKINNKFIIYINNKMIFFLNIKLQKIKLKLTQTVKILINYNKIKIILYISPDTFSR